VNRSFYDRPVLEVAPDLVGCVLHHGATSGVIVETEAYHESEEACHAYIGLTKRTSTIFGPPGIAYVYRSYGIHALVNAVLTQALDIELHHNGVDLTSGPIVISERPPEWRDVQIVADRRIGITRAAELPWRFSAAGSRFLSRAVARDAAVVPVAARTR
jgi:DNA-3-methyladenine glycosylase